MHPVEAKVARLMAHLVKKHKLSGLCYTFTREDHMVGAVMAGNFHELAECADNCARLYRSAREKMLSALEKTAKGHRK